jgi:excisionase family DNA binding protein
LDSKTAPQLYRREDLARKLNISLRAADELILSKKIPSLKIGKRRLVSETAIATFIRKQEAAAA